MEREEDDASDAVWEGLAADGVVFELAARTQSVTHAHDVFHLTLESGRTLEADGMLVATGRTPNTRDLQTERSGIECDERGFIRVNDYLQTTCPGIYAIGDVAKQPAFTHVSWEDYRRLSATFAGKPRKRDDRVLSYSTFTEPQLARTGLTLAQAREKKIDARAQTLKLEDVARATEWNLERGFMRLVVDKATDQIVGATLVGYEMGELVHTLALAIQLGATWRDLDRLVAIHPTFGEGLPTLARLFEN